MFNLIRRVSSGIWSRNRPAPDSEPSTDAPLVGSKRRRDADDDDANTVMQIDELGQRKRARSKEPDSDVPDTPTGSQFITPSYVVSDAADAARDASPFPISRSQSATDSVREQTEAVKNVTLADKQVVVEEPAATKEETIPASEEATPSQDEDSAKVEHTIDQNAATASTETLPATVPVTTTETETPPATVLATTETETSEAAQGSDNATEAKADTEETTASPASAASDSETSTAVAPGDTVEPTTTTKIVEVQATTDDTTEDATTVVRSSASPEPMAAAPKS